MLRVSLIAALVASAATFASASVARADDCMCALAVLGDAEWDRPAWRLDQSVEVGPFFSSDGTTLVSRLARSGDDAGQPAQELARRRVPVEDVLWCVSADDPRCSPRDSSPSDGSRIAEARINAHQVTDSEPPLPSPLAARPKPSHSGDGPRAGVRFRIDRPPSR